MSESKVPEPSRRRRNPLMWIVLAVVGLIIYVYLSGDRTQSFGDSAQTVASGGSDSGTIERASLIPPGMRARQKIDEMRESEAPVPLALAFETANRYLQDGSLADAHLLYFFAARENHLPSIMKMGEMADPLYFKAEDSLLDHADAIQAYKWYQRAAQLGHQAANNRINSLEVWAKSQSSSGDPQARQLLLNFE